MADLIAVSEAIVERLTPILPDWHMFFYEPSPIPVPALCVEGDPAKAADYPQSWGDNTKWFLKLTFYVTANDQEAAVRLLGPLTGRKGPVVQALEDKLADYNDTLTQLAKGNVQATALTRWGTTRRNRNRYRTACIAVTVGTN